MGRHTLDTVAKLLAKARSTSSDSEAEALVERCYVLLAQFLNVAEQDNPSASGRRRDRRLLRDRRRRPLVDDGRERPRPRRVEGAVADPVTRYRSVAGAVASGARDGLDVSL